MNWISIKEKLPENGQKVDIWVKKNGIEYRETDCEFIESIEFHRIPGFRKISIKEIMFFLEDEYVTHYMVIEQPKNLIIKNEMLMDACHCGKPIDFSNPDCVEFSLCKDCAMDS